MTVPPERQSLWLRSERPLYYGWVLVGVLSITVTVSYGVLMYAFAVVLAPMQANLGWSQAVLTGGFSLAAIVLGAALAMARAGGRQPELVADDASASFPAVVRLPV